MSGDRQEEIVEALKFALKQTNTALTEAVLALERGPDWYTKGRVGMWSQVRAWSSRAAEAQLAADRLLNESPSPSVTHQTGDKP